MATKFPSPAGSGTDRRAALVRELRERLGRSATVAAESLAKEEADDGAGPRTFSSGAAAIDRLLPGGGLRHGMLVEWLAERAGCGAATLGLVAAREACKEGGVMVVVDRARAFYPPAAAGWGVDPARLIVARPRTPRDEIWAAVQSLRSPVVAAVWTMIDRLDSRNFRRLQLAAEAGGTLGVLVRGASARGQPSWADVRLGVGGPLSVVRRPLPSHHGLRTTDHGQSLRVSLLHVRGGRSGGSVGIAIDEVAHEVREMVTQHAPHPLPVVAELADPAARSHPARA